jgi:hypothetical protein
MYLSHCDVVPVPFERPAQSFPTALRSSGVASATVGWIAIAPSSSQRCSLASTRLARTSFRHCRSGTRLGCCPPVPMNTGSDLSNLCLCFELILLFGRHNPWVGHRCNIDTPEQSLLSSVLERARRVHHLGLARAGASLPAGACLFLVSPMPGIVAVVVRSWIGPPTSPHHGAPYLRLVATPHGTGLISFEEPPLRAIGLAQPFAQPAHPPDR